MSGAIGHEILKTMEIKDKLAFYIMSGYVQPEIKRCREIQKFCTMIVTGDNQQEIIVNYYDKEDEKQKEQRYKLYDSRTEYVSNKTKSVFKQTDRSDGINPIIKYEPPNPNAQIELGERLRKFHANNTLVKWLNPNYRDLVFTDPNAAILVDFDEFDYISEKPFVYPVVFHSDQQIERIFRNGVLEELTVSKGIKVTVNKDGKNQIETVNEYCTYIADSAVTVREVLDGEIDKPKPFESDFSEGYYFTYSYEKETKTFFAVNYSTKSKRVPAVIVGYLKDKYSRFDNVYHFPMLGACKILQELIKKKSTYDTHLALHGILQKFAYVPACDYKDATIGISCNSGKLTNGNTCPKCNGTGKMPFHQSEQDIITIELPNYDKKDEMFDLSKLVYYQTVPTELIEMHKQAVDDLEQKVSLAIFNTNMFDRKELIGGTATEIRANLTHVNNELFEYDEGKSKVWEFIVYQTAIFLENDKNLIVKKQNPTDYKLESINDLIALRQAATTANAPIEVQQSIDTQILEKQYADNVEFLEAVKARERWKPFSDKSESERVSAITLLAQDDKQRVLYFNFKSIFNDIENAETYEVENAKPPFHKLPYDRQKQVVEYYVNLYTPEINTLTIRESAPINAE